MPAKTPATKLYCTRCDDEAHENSVEHKVFYYCRTCKVEVFSPASSPRKKDVVNIHSMSHFYSDTEGEIHCSFCTAKSGMKHSASCTRTPIKNHIQLMLDALDNQLAFDFRKGCSHSSTYSDGKTAWCLLCQKDLS